jgi:3-aminobutyryl-CoA ammonia-lyase
MIHVGLTVTHRQYVRYSHAHYAGSLIDGAYALGLFGDVATEICIRGDGDEGLFASYSDVQFRAPMRAGDVLEVTGRVVRVGTRSRTLAFECRVVCRSAAALADMTVPADPIGYMDPSTRADPTGRADPTVPASAARVLDPPLLAVTATGTVVVPARP